MSRITIYEGNSIKEERTYASSLTLDTTLSAFTVSLHIRENKTDLTSLITATGVVSGTGVTFTVPAASNTLEHGVYYFEVTAESSVNKITLEQDRVMVKESIIYIT